MRKRDVELEEYLNDLEIQLAISKVQHTNRTRGKLRMQRKQRMGSKQDSWSRMRMRQVENE